MRKKDLSHCRGEVDDQALAKIRRSANNSRHEIRLGSLLYNFRQLEIETGYFFSSRTVSSLMEKYETVDDTLNQGSKVKGFFRKPPTSATTAALAQSSFIPPEKIISLQDYLLRSRFGEERRAAATAEVFYFSGPSLGVNKDNEQVVTVIHGRYNPPDYNPLDHSMALEGFFDALLPKEISEDQAAFAWLLPGGTLVPAEDFWFDRQERSFNVIFADIPSRFAAENGRLRCCVIEKGIRDYVRD